MASGENQDLHVAIAVVKQRQDDIDRRQDAFITSVGKTLDQVNRNVEKIWEEVNSIHGHITRCRDEIRRDIDSDFASQDVGNKDKFLMRTEAEVIRGEVKQINTKLYMTGAGITLAVSLVQIAIAVLS